MFIFEQGFHEVGPYLPVIEVGVKCSLHLVRGEQKPCDTYQFSEIY